MDCETHGSVPQGGIASSAASLNNSEFINTSTRGHQSVFGERTIILGRVMLQGQQDFRIWYLKKKLA